VLSENARRRFREAGKEDLFRYLQEETIVIMTEPLQYDTEVEGWRPLIKERCKTAFRAKVDLDDYAEILGEKCLEDGEMEKWWSMNEAEIVEIPYDWGSDT